MPRDNRCKKMSPKELILMRRRINQDRFEKERSRESPMGSGIFMSRRLAFTHHHCLETASFFRGILKVDCILNSYHITDRSYQSWSRYTKIGYASMITRSARDSPDHDSITHQSCIVFVAIEIMAMPMLLSGTLATVIIAGRAAVSEEELQGKNIAVS